MIKCLFIGAIFAAGLSAGSASAQTDEDDSDESPWEIILGVDGIYEPKTEGSSVYEFVPKAYFDITYEDRWFLSSDDGVGAYILHSDERELGIGLTRGDDRQEDDDPLLLAGLPKIKKGLAPTIFFSQEFKNIQWQSRIVGPSQGHT